MRVTLSNKAAAVAVRGLVFLERSGFLGRKP